MNSSSSGSVLTKLLAVREQNWQENGTTVMQVEGTLVSQILDQVSKQKDKLREKAKKREYLNVNQNVYG